ncbi:MAG: ABC transporter substrate-binding protein [Christensenellales bacterium]
MKKALKFMALILVMVMALSVFAGCDQAAPVKTSAPAATTAAPAKTDAPVATTPAAPTFNGEIKFGVILSLTGDAASNHVRAKDGITLAAKEINDAGGVLGKKVILQIEDEQTTPDGCVLAASKLYATDMVALIGPNRTAHTTAIMEQIDKGGKPVVCESTGPSLTKANTHEWLFFGRPSDIVTATNAAKFLVENLKCKKIGILFVNDDFGTGGKDVIKAAAEALGATVVEQGHNAGDKDLSGQILAIKNGGCDAVVTWTHTAEVALFARQRLELGLTIPYLGSVSVTESNTTDLLDANMLEGVYSVCDAAPDATDPIMSAIIAKCKATYGYDINVMYMAVHGILNELCWAIEKAGSTEPKAMADALRSLDGTQLKTAMGKAICDKNQVLSQLCLVLQCDNAKKWKTVAQLG